MPAVQLSEPEGLLSLPPEEEGRAKRPSKPGTQSSDSV